MELEIIFYMSILILMLMTSITISNLKEIKYHSYKKSFRDFIKGEKHKS